MKADIHLDKKKLELIQWLSSLENISVIDKLLALKNQEKQQKEDWFDMISQQERNSIEKGIKDSDSGKLKPHSEARKRYGKWL